MVVGSGPSEPIRVNPRNPRLINRVCRCRITDALCPFAMARFSPPVYRPLPSRISSIPGNVTGSASGFCHHGGAEASRSISGGFGVVHQFEFAAGGMRCPNAWFGSDRDRTQAETGRCNRSGPRNPRITRKQDLRIEPPNQDERTDWQRELSGIFWRNLPSEFRVIRVFRGHLFCMAAAETNSALETTRSTFRAN